MKVRVYQRQLGRKGRPPGAAVLSKDLFMGTVMTLAQVEQLGEEALLKCNVGLAMSTC